MNYFHKKIIDRWKKYSIFEQMANIGAEVGRAINWRKKNNVKMSLNAFYRALELIDLTIEDKKNRHLLKEILRLREILADYFVGDNIYRSSDEDFEKYFYHYSFAARKNF